MSMQQHDCAPIKPRLSVNNGSGHSPTSILYVDTIMRTNKFPRKYL